MRRLRGRWDRRGCIADRRPHLSSSCSAITLRNFDSQRRRAATTNERVWIPITEAEWAEGASRHLKAELKRAGITYDGLANLLKRQGFRDETRASVSIKLASGKFTPAFFLASLFAIGCEVIRLDEIQNAGH